jgi:hypothetical protein
MLCYELQIAAFSSCPIDEYIETSRKIDPLHHQLHRSFDYDEQSHRIDRLHGWLHFLLEYILITHVS